MESGSRRSQGKGEPMVALRRSRGRGRRRGEGCLPAGRGGAGRGPSSCAGLGAGRASRSLPASAGGMAVRQPGGAAGPSGGAVASAAGAAGCSGLLLSYSTALRCATLFVAPGELWPGLGCAAALLWRSCGVENGEMQPLALSERGLRAGAVKDYS